MISPCLTLASVSFILVALAFVVAAFQIGKGAAQSPDNLIKALFLLLVAAFAFTMGVGGLCGNEHMTKMTSYSYLGQPGPLGAPASYTTPEGAAAYANMNVFAKPGDDPATIKKFSGIKRRGVFPPPAAPTPAETQAYLKPQMNPMFPKGTMFVDKLATDANTPMVGPVTAPVASGPVPAGSLAPVAAPSTGLAGVNAKSSSGPSPLPLSFRPQTTNL